MTSVAPTARVANSCSTKGSKLKVANCSTLSLATSPRAWIAASVCRASARWVKATPLGRPVEPEVKIT
jgi:hypothetical protein